MTSTFASIGYGNLNDEAKLALVGQLWDELLASAPPGGLLTAGQRDELQRRQADALARPDDWVSWDEVYAESVRRLGP